MPTDNDQQTTTTPAPGPTFIQQNVPAVADTGILQGLGKYRSIVAGGFAFIVGTLFVIGFQFFLSQFKEMMVQQRQDALEYRTLFRESVRDIQREADRRAGEVKGALDKNTEVVRQWIEESRASRAARGVPPSPPGGTPRPASPP